MSLFETATERCECVECRIRRAISETPIDDSIYPPTNAEVITALCEVMATLLAKEPTWVAKGLVQKLLQARKINQKREKDEAACQTNAKQLPDGLQNTTSSIVGKALRSMGRTRRARM